MFSERIITSDNGAERVYSIYVNFIICSTHCCTSIYNTDTQNRDPGALVIRLGGTV